MNRFKPKRKLKIKIKYIIFSLLIVFIYSAFMYVSNKFSVIHISSSNLYNTFFSDINTHISYDKNDYFGDFISSKINKPLKILKNNFIKIGDKK